MSSSFITPRVVPLGAIGALATGLVLVGACDTIAMSVMRKKARNSIFRDTVATLPDGLHAGFCGTGSPFPSPTRAGPCTAIVAGHRLFIVDVGRGAPDVMARMGLSAGRIEAVLLTHFHADHIDGLGQLGEQHWVAWSAKSPLVVMGPTGVDRVVNGFNEAHALNGTYRTAHHGPAVAVPSGFGLVARPFDLAEGLSSMVVLDQGGLRITAFTVNHEPVRPAVGYRFDYQGRSIVISGDTGKSANVVRASEGVDLLIHEAMSPRLVGILEESAEESGREPVVHIFRDLRSFHTAPSDAADEASQARAHALALTHFIPPVPLDSLEGPFLGDAREHFGGPLYVTKDGDLISIPARNGEP